MQPFSFRREFYIIKEIYVCTRFDRLFFLFGSYYSNSSFAEFRLLSLNSILTVSSQVFQASFFLNFLRDRHYCLLSKYKYLGSYCRFDRGIFGRYLYPRTGRLSTVAADRRFAHVQMIKLDKGLFGPVMDVCLHTTTHPDGIYHFMNCFSIDWVGPPMAIVNYFHTRPCRIPKEKEANEDERT